MLGEPEKKYMENAVGHLVPIEQIKAIDLARHELVTEVATAFLEAKKSLQKLKEKTVGDIEAFIQMGAEEYGVQVGGKKGNVSLYSYDGKYKLHRQISEYLVFDERLQAAKCLIDECIKDWSQGANANITVLVNAAFEVDKQGKINVGRVLSLRQLKIDDDRWKRAMEAISDSLQVVGSKAYIRLYERGANGEYNAVSLDMSVL